MVMTLNESCILHHKGIDSLYRIWHTPGENMIIYFHSGSGSIVASERSYPIERGAICFIGADKFHYTLPETAVEYDRSKVFVSNETLSALFSLFPKQLEVAQLFQSSSLVYAKIPEHDQPLIEAMFHDIGNATGDAERQVVMRSVYTRLLLFIFDNVLHTSSQGGVLQKAIDYINANIGENLSMDTICDAVHISKYHFCRKFKAVTGNTVMDYILKTRIINAKNRLLNSRDSISEISENCGFSSISYFCRVFKQSEGMSPLKYRRLNAKEPR